MAARRYRKFRNRFNNNNNESVKTDRTSENGDARYRTTATSVSTSQDSYDQSIDTDIESLIFDNDRDSLYYDKEQKQTNDQNEFYNFSSPFKRQSPETETEHRQYESQQSLEHTSKSQELRVNGNGVASTEHVTIDIDLKRHDRFIDMPPSTNNGGHHDPQLTKSITSTLGCERLSGKKLNNTTTTTTTTMTKPMPMAMKSSKHCSVDVWHSKVGIVGDTVDRQDRCWYRRRRKHWIHQRHCKWHQFDQRERQRITLSLLVFGLILLSVIVTLIWYYMSWTVGLPALLVALFVVLLTKPGWRWFYIAAVTARRDIT